MRARGWSYSVISERINVPKSTLSGWLRDVAYVPNKTVSGRISAGPLKSARVRNAIKLKTIADAKLSADTEIGEMSDRDLLMLGLGLYIGEGSKANESVRIINSDPNTVRLAMRWFRQTLKLENENLRADIHLYPDVDIEQAITYWSNITGLPKDRFGKTQIDRRLDKSERKSNKLMFGTLHITVISNGNKLNGVLLHRRIMALLEIIYKRV